jgi:prevent-host-death family protein
MDIGAYDAKTNLGALLRRVALGEQITITKHGVPVAKLVPVSPPQKPADVKTTIKALKELRRGNKLDGLSLRGLINHGRR